MSKTGTQGLSVLQVKPNSLVLTTSTMSGHENSSSKDGLFSWSEVERNSNENVQWTFPNLGISAVLKSCHSKQISLFTTESNCSAA